MARAITSAKRGTAGICRFGKPVPALAAQRLDALCEKGWAAKTEGGYVPTVRGLFEEKAVEAALLG